MLSSEVVKKIEDFVYPKPRSVQEISEHIEKNWRTADRYVNEIEKEYGTITTRVFREGTRGALKIVHWSSIEKISNSVFQEQLEQNIISGRKREDFSAIDIFQHVQDKNKKVDIKVSDNKGNYQLDSLIDLLLSPKKQLLIFSGNLSFINYKNKKNDLFKLLEGLVKKGVNIKVVCRVDFAGIKNIEKLLSLNFKYGKELIEIRHREQPLRAIIVDNKFFNIKEVKEPINKDNELNKKTAFYYTIKDKEWNEWITRIFWKMFSSSISANKRLEEINKLKVKY